MSIIKFIGMLTKINQKMAKQKKQSCIQRARSEINLFFSTSD